jgi:4-hydroxy-tetrahydrodipicolinate reductase
MIKAIVAGAAGRMGGRILHMIRQRDDIVVAGAFDRKDHPLLGQDAGQVTGLGPIGTRLGDSLEGIADQGDVLIDFTNPEATLENIQTAAKHGLAVVIGTTGLSGQTLERIERIAKTIRCVMSPNMSVGVNVMFRMAGEMARLLGDEYDMEIVEVHHRLKKDAPSGTAMRLAQVLSSSMNRDLDKVAVYQRKGMIGERTDQEIGIQTLRAGDITGEHMVMFGGIGERLELVHRAHNRDNFAKGAVRAALWVVHRPPGLYDMQDVLGLRG